MKRIGQEVKECLQLAQHMVKVSLCSALGLATVGLCLALTSCSGMLKPLLIFELLLTALNGRIHAVVVHYADPGHSAPASSSKSRTPGSLHCRCSLYAAALVSLLDGNT